MSPNPKHIGLKALVFLALSYALPSFAADPVNYCSRENMIIGFDLEQADASELNELGYLIPGVLATATITILTPAIDAEVWVRFEGNGGDFVDDHELRILFPNPILTSLSFSFIPTETTESGYFAVAQVWVGNEYYCVQSKRYNIAETYKLVTEVPGADMTTPVPSVDIQPSVIACAKDENSAYSRDSMKKKQINIRCEKATTGETVDGCSFDAALSRDEEDYDGGHDRVHSGDRPIGRVLPIDTSGLPRSIPLSGTSIEYESPDVAGIVTLTLEGTGPDGIPIQSKIIKFRVKVDEFTQLQIPEIDGRQWLVTDVQSHPSGTYGTAHLNDSMPALTEAYRNALALAELDLENANPLESEAVSLPWGGVFDVQRNWKQPHCTHRDGTAFDISVTYIESRQSLISADEQVAIKKALQGTSTIFYAKPENKPSHWHVKLLQ